MSVPTNSLLSSMLNALAADTTTLAGGLQVHLVTAPFGSTRSLAWGDVSTSLSAVAGMGSISVAGAPQQRATDPVKGDELIQLIPPVGGFRWESSAAPDPPVTMYGYIVCSSTGNGETVYLSRRFAEGIVINAAHQVIEVLAPDLRLTLDDFVG